MAGKRTAVGWIVLGVIALAWIGDDDDPPRDGRVQQVKLTPQYSAPQPLVSPPVAEPRPTPAERTLYTTARVNLREHPNTQSRILTTLQPGTSVRSAGTDGAWSRVRTTSADGWIRNDFLSPKPPRSEPQAFYAPARPAPPAGRSGQPVREPYVGTCDCPYDRKRNGHLCGGSSAYSRPGGRSPRCYF